MSHGTDVEGKKGSHKPSGSAKGDTRHLTTTPQRAVFQNTSKQTSGTDTGTFPQGGIQAGAGGMAEDGPACCCSSAWGRLGSGSWPAAWRCGAAASGRDEAASEEANHGVAPLALAGGVALRGGRDPWAGGHRACDRRRLAGPRPAVGPRPSHAVLAEEQRPAVPHRPRARRHRVRRLVDVLDRYAPRPRRISIPAIGVSAAIVPLRLEPDGTMQTPDRFQDAGWYEPGREPGERGPAVIAGHVDSTAGAAIFHRLRDLRRGNLIRIRRADGSVVRFRVEGLERWPKAKFPTRRVFSRAGRGSPRCGS